MRIKGCQLRCQIDDSVFVSNTVFALLVIFGRSKFACPKMAHRIMARRERYDVIYKKSLLFII